MGKAKQRGTYEQRVAMAQDRNEYLSHQVKFGSSLHKIQMRNGIQRVATVLTAAGMIPVPLRKYHPNVK